MAMTITCHLKNLPHHMSHCMGKPTTWSKFSICTFLHKISVILQMNIIWNIRVTHSLSIEILHHNIIDLNFTSWCYMNFHCMRYLIEFRWWRISHDINVSFKGTMHFVDLFQFRKSFILDHPWKIPFCTWWRHTQKLSSKTEEGVS